MYVGQSHGIDVVASDALERATAGLQDDEVHCLAALRAGGRRRKRMVFCHNAHAGLRREHTELTVAGDAGGRAAMTEIRAGSIWLQEFWHSCVVTMADGQVIYETIFVMH